MLLVERAHCVMENLTQSWEILPSSKILALFFCEHFCACSKISVGFVPLLAIINWVLPLALKGKISHEVMRFSGHDQLDESSCAEG